MKRCYAYLSVLVTLLPSLARGDFEFTLATCNVLFEQYYKGYSKIPTMPALVRAQAFQNAISKAPAPLKDVDIYCFQEWPGLNSFHESLYEDIKAKNYSAIIPEKTPLDKTILTYNSNKFATLETGYKVFQDPKNRAVPVNNNNKSIVYAVLESLKEKQIVIVINVHVPWSSPKMGAGINPSYAASLAEIKGIINQLQAKYPDPILVLCGDFNFDTWTADGVNLADYNLLKNTIFGDTAVAISSNAETAVLPTAFGSSAKPEYQFNDYIFYSTNVSAQFSMYPEDISQFIRHSQPPADAGKPGYKNYFSDHAIIRATFTKKAAAPGDGGPGPVGPDPVPPVPPKPVDSAALIQALNTLTNSLNDVAENLEKAAF